MKKSVKIIFALIIAFMLISTISTICYGFEGGKVGTVDIPSAQSASTTDIAAKAAKIIATLRNIAAIAAVIIISILGIKYMIGSVEEKAEYKKSFIPLIIGVVVVVLALQIANVIFNLA
ncbi:MAG: TrbC/VirB2 family protein [Clostridia bacterium]|nr:TrbC/VirB2 family protein [Clostridia bacterium]